MRLREYILPTQTVTQAGVEIKFPTGEHYWSKEESLTANQNPVYELPFTARNLVIEIESMANITVKFNSTTNEAITIKIDRVYVFDSFKVTKIFVTNPEFCEISMFATD